MAAANGNNQNQVWPRHPSLIVMEPDWVELISSKDIEELRSSQKRLLLITPNYANELFNEFSSPLGGRGIQATRAITRGTPIISEEALFSVVDRNRVRLTNRNDPRFRALICPTQQPTPQAEAMARFKANSFGMGKVRDGREEDGIFLQAAKFNHSCAPNAHFAWNPQTQRLTVHALETIPMGMEILVNYRTYEFTTKSRVQRQSDLTDIYNFTCTCRACLANPNLGIESDDRRQRMRTLQTNLDRMKKIRGAVQLSDRQSQLTCIRSLTAYMHLEGFIYPQPAEMYEEEIDWYRREMRTNIREAGNAMYTASCREVALQLARNKLDLDVAFTGHNSQVVTGTLRVINDLKSM